MSLIKLSGAKPEAEVQFAEKDLEIAMALIKLSGAKPEAEVQFAEKDLAIQRLLQAAALLEFGTQRSKANPKFALMLVRLYFRLGAGSLAIRAYQRLGIKQIQGDTLGYMLFDRISTLHPHPVSGSSSIEDDMDPSDQLRKMQGLYRRQREQIRTSIWRSFEHGSYDSIFQLMEVSDKLSRSTAAAMMTIELSRITRFIDPKAAQHKISLGYNTLSTDPLLQEYSDNSDYTSFPNFETSASAPFEMYTRPGPGPSSDRYRVMLLVDLLWMVVTCHPNHVTQKTCLLLDLQTSIRAVEQLLPDTMTGNCLTYPERHYIFTASKLARLVLAHFDPHSPPPGELLSHTVETVTEGVLTSRDLIDQINVDDTHYFPGFLHTLHPLYMAHDLASLIVAVSHFIKQSPYAGIRATHESSDVYQELAKQLQSRVSEKAEAIRNRLNAGSWLDFIMDQVRIEDEPTNNPRADPGSKIAVLFDEKPAFIENFAAELLDSWRESTLGLASLQSL
ncbi:MAG: hypothetical protein M1818_001728 [Claussenomyces sp. TS43310]|nr:MAG: hypothetical protein M1818_001728 [Claussenomyces sp. TS43310]